MKTIVKIFTPNKDGKIEFTKEELEELLKNMYDTGYEDGKASSNGNYFPYTPRVYPFDSDKTNESTPPNVKITYSET